MAIGCFDNTTAKTVTEAGLSLDCEAPLPGMPSFAGALEIFL